MIFLRFDILKMKSQPKIAMEICHEGHVLEFFMKKEN